jgi:D-alanyl-D-alanine carboxypeptidase
MTPGAGSTITIRELLEHRSGLANFTDGQSWLARAERSDTIRPRDVLRFAASKDPVFRAGSQWEHSNTNFVALGLVTEKLTGQTRPCHGRAGSVRRVAWQERLQCDP